MAKAIKNYGVISKRTRWGLTLWGWLTIIALLCIGCFVVIYHLYGFLSPTVREKTTVLVLEGYVSDYVLQEATNEFRDYSYDMLITTGTPLERGLMLAEYTNTADLAASTLRKMGLDSAFIVVVKTDESINDRTFNAALDLKEYLEHYAPEIKSINLMTQGVHGRRSQLMYQAALGDSIKVGIISVPNLYYGAHDWWKNSKGFREVMNEALAYFFTKLLFKPYTKEEKETER
ncbi:ElyC/SanA/YdcF family protein [Bacteroidota bacterium]